MKPFNGLNRRTAATVLRDRYKSGDSDRDTHKAWLLDGSAYKSGSLWGLMVDASPSQAPPPAPANPEKPNKQRDLSRISINLILNIFSHYIQCRYLRITSKISHFNFKAYHST